MPEQPVKEFVLYQLSPVIFNKEIDITAISKWNFGDFVTISVPHCKLITAYLQYDSVQFEPFIPELNDLLINVMERHLEQIATELYVVPDLFKLDMDARTAEFTIASQGSNVTGKVVFGFMNKDRFLTEIYEFLAESDAL